MPLYYSLSGVIADIMLCFTLTLLLAGMSGFGATLTLPGIAGIVLTIGMAVDANVLIYERIREELNLGMKPKEAVSAGFSRASISITDSNLTTIIAAAILYQFGTGPIRGFAVTLTLGIIASMFTAIFVSRGVFELWMNRNGGARVSV
jgi:preprotein translocase subunit SecD